MIEKTVVYRDYYGLPLNKWNTLMNKLWYYTAERNKLWAKLVYYPLRWLEQMKYKISSLKQSN